MTVRRTRRRALLDAAAALLEEEGREALSTRSIAARAGVSTQGVYTAFGSREGLIEALRDELAHQVDEHTLGVSRPVEALERWWDWCLARPDAARLLYGVGMAPAPLPAALARLERIDGSRRSALWCGLRGALVIALEGGWSTASEGERAWRLVWASVTGRG